MYFDKTRQLMVFTESEYAKIWMYVTDKIVLIVPD